MGGGGGGGTQIIRAETPDIYEPVAPERTAPEAMPDNVNQSLVDFGGQESAEEAAKRRLGASRLIIPLEDNTQAGGYTQPREPTGVV